MIHPLRCYVLLSVLGLGLLVGCSDGRPRRVPVSGQVFIDGQPLQFGFIRVWPEDARPATGFIQNGQFELGCYELDDGCVTGTHPVTVSASANLSENQIKWLAPKKYGDPRTSGLTVTISEPTDDVRIDLTWDGKQPFVEAQ